MRRREFLASGVGALALGTQTLATGAAARATARREPFGMKYAPHIGMFDNHAKDPIDQIKFMADQGFRAIEDNWMRRREPAMQDKIRAELDRHGMEMGVFVATAGFDKPTFTSTDPGVLEQCFAEIRESVEVAKRVGAKWCTVVPGGYSQQIEWDYQTATAIENLKRAAAICEPSGLVLVLEALNPWTNHPGCFLSKIPQAYLLCKAVGSPSCKILFDIYHQQITEGNLIPNIDKAWDEIAYFQIGDNPGRNEPGTGEINYRNVFRHIRGKGYDGVLGMEHGNSMKGREGELAVIEAYRECDKR